MLKKEPALDFASDGSIRLSKKHPEAAADTTEELRVRLCMQRRALAFQIANIGTFVTLDVFIAKLFSLLVIEQFPLHRLLQQIKRCGKKYLRRLVQSLDPFQSASEWNAFLEQERNGPQQAPPKKAKKQCF